MKPGIRIDGSSRRDLNPERIAARMAGLEAGKPTVAQKIARLEAAEKRAKGEARDAKRPRTDLRTQTVDNPYFSKAHSENKEGNYRRIGVQVNIRESAVATMAARGLLDAGQVEAADRFRELYEAMGGSGVSAMDYGQEPVDGGGAREVLSTAQIEAGQRLAAVRTRLGHRNYDLVSRVCGEGRSLGEIAAIRRQRDTAADNLKAALDDVAIMWGIAVRKGPAHAKKDKADPGSAGLGKLRGARAFTPEPPKAGVVADTAWADAQSDRRRERKAGKDRETVNSQRTRKPKSSAQS